MSCFNASTVKSISLANRVKLFFSFLPAIFTPDAKSVFCNEVDICCHTYWLANTRCKPYFLSCVSAFSISLEIKFWNSSINSNIGTRFCIAMLVRCSAIIRNKPTIKRPYACTLSLQALPSDSLNRIIFLSSMSCFRLTVVVFEIRF